MDSLSFDDILNDGASDKAAAPSDLSFDDIVGSSDSAEAPKPAPKNRFRYNANTPEKPEAPARKPAPISAREPADADTSSAMGDIEAGIQTLKQVRPALAVVGSAGDIARANRMEKGAARDETELAQIDQRLAEIEKLPDDQWQQAGDERAKLTARRSQLMMLYPQGQGPQSAKDEAAILKPKAVKSIVENIDEIQKLNKAIEAVPTNPAAKRFNSPEGETLGEQASSMWDALADDPYGVVRTTVLRSLPSSAPTMIASVVGGIAGPGGAASMAALAGGSIEMGTSMAQYLSEDLQKRGIDPTDQAAVEKYAVENIDEILTMIGKARTRAVVIGGVSGVVGGATEKLAEGVVTAPFKKKAATAIAGAGIESVGDSAGEAAAEVAAGDQLSLPDIIGEGIGSLGTGAVTTSGQIARESLTSGRGAKVETVPEKGANSAETAALAAANQTVAPPQRPPVSPAAREPAEVKAGVSVGETSPEITEAVTAASNQPQAPQPPVPGTGPGAAGEYVKQLARFREMERRAQEQAQAPAQNTVTEPASSPAPVAEGPQVGGAPAAPPTLAPSPAANALQGLDAAREDRAPVEPGAVSAPTESPAKQAADALPPVAETTPAPTTAPSEAGGSAPAAEAPKERKYRTVSRRDVLLDAGIPAEQYDGMKDKARGRIASELRAKVQRETGLVLERMDTDEREQALTKAWTEMQAARQKAQQAAQEARAKLPPKAKKAVETSKAKETGPTAEEVAAQKEAEKQARIAAWMEEQRKQNEAEAAKPVEPGQKRVLRPTSEEALRKDAEAAIAMQDKQAENESKLKEPETPVAEPAPVVNKKAAKKMGEEAVARREHNNNTASEIAKEFAPSETERSFEKGGKEGATARESVLARARNILKAAQERMQHPKSGSGIPGSRALGSMESLQPNNDLFLVMEARDLLRVFDNPDAKYEKKRAALARFMSNEFILRQGMRDEYLTGTRAEGAAAKGSKGTGKVSGEEGDSRGKMEAVADINGDEITRAGENPDEPSLIASNMEDRILDRVDEETPRTTREREQVTSEVKEGIDYDAGTGRTAKVVQTVSKGGRKKLELPAEARARAAEAAKALTSAAKAAADAPTRPKLTLKQDTTVRSNKGNISLSKMPRIILDKMTMAEAMDRLDPGSIKLFGDKNTQKVIGAILGRLKEALPDFPIIIIPHSEMMRVTDGGAAAYFDPKPSRFGQNGYIAISAKYAEDGNPRAHLVAHEGLHALFSAALANDPDLHDLVTSLGDYVRGSYSSEEAANQHYGLTIDKKTGRVDPHEFLSEALSEPEFQEILRDTPIPDEVAALLNLDKNEDKTVWGALRSMVRDIVLGINKALFGGGDEYSALDAVMEIGSRLDKLGTEIRKRRGESAVPAGPMSEVRYAKTGKKNPNVGELMKRGLDLKTARNAAKIIAENFKDGISAEDLDAVAHAFLNTKEQKKQSYWNMLKDGGVPQAQAKEINDFLKAEVGKTVDPETVPFLIEEAIKAFGKKDTSESNPSDGGIIPPYKEPPSPGMGPAEPKQPDAPAFKGKGESRVQRFLRTAALKTMTLDFLRQKFGKLFVDKDGVNQLDRFNKAIQRRDNIVDEFAEPLEKAGVEFEEFARANPEEALEFAQLAMDASRLNVKLGKNEDNSHLGGNAAKGLQGKQALDKLNERFEKKLSDKGRALYKRLTKLYREAHNANVEALAYNILSELDTKLSNSNLMDLMKRVTEGRLTEDDAKLINNNTLFHALERASELKVLKGDYFPMMRYGDYVVTTTEKLVDPGWTSVPMKVTRNKVDPSGKITKVVTTKDIQAKTEVEGNAIRVQVDPTIRGSQTAAKRALRDYAAKHELTLQGISTMYRDKKTGKLVSKGEQMVDREYDTVYEARFQTEGVHFFESAKEAEEFREQSDSHITSQVMNRQQYSGEDAISGSQLAAIVNHIGGDEKGPLHQKMVNLVENAVIAQMAGNRAQKRYLARRNVIGASQDIARAAFTFARASGNYHATLRTAPEMREAMKAMTEIEKASRNTDSAATITAVMNEMRAREANIQNPNKPMKWTRDVATLSYFDKLFSPAYSFINAMQPLTTTWPTLAGRYGWDNTIKAMASAYAKVGLKDTIVAGGVNTAKAAMQIQKTMVDTSDLIGSLRKNLGKEYEALIDELVERGLLNVDTGLEIGSVIEQGRGAWGRALHKVDRIGRQLPNGVEVLNRAITAVATYDLARQAGKSKQDAIQEAYNTTSNTQGDYRGSNAPNWMKAPGLGWMLQFKKYMVLQYQLMGDMAYRSFKDADPAERIIARKQLTHLVATQAALAGTWGLPGLEIAKLGFMAVSMLAGGDGWEDEEYKLRKMIEEKTGKTMGSIINNGLLSTVTGLDFASRLSLADMITGMPPKSFDADGLMAYAGRTIGGAPGGTVVDWATGIRELVKANSSDAREKAVQKLIPMKLIADSVSAYTNYQNGNVGPAGAAAQVFGMRPLDLAEKGRERGALKRQSEQKKGDEKSLTNDLRAALDRGDKKAELKAIAAIRDYNMQLKRKDPKARPLNPAQIRKYWYKDKRKAAQ